jgi:hypothetical protein
MGLLSKKKEAHQKRHYSLKNFDMQHNTCSQLMRLSWQIQKRRKTARSLSLLSAPPIYLAEDLTVNTSYKNTAEPDRFRRTLHNTSLYLIIKNFLSWKHS